MIEEKLTSVESDTVDVKSDTVNVKSDPSSSTFSSAASCLSISTTPSLPDPMLPVISPVMSPVASSAPRKVGLFQNIYPEQYSPLASCSSPDTFAAAPAPAEKAGIEGDVKVEMNPPTNAKATALTDFSFAERFELQQKYCQYIVNEALQRRKKKNQAPMENCIKEEENWHTECPPLMFDIWQRERTYIAQQQGTK
jgi:hypothetical protein